MTSTRLLVPAALVLLAAAGAASAQPYKVIGPDGKVTYTDRPPSNAGKVTALGGRNAPAVTEVPMPPELREPVSRYPVTLYTTSGACEPCSGARALLRQRGVPYAERQVMTSEDNDALARITGGREVPVLMIGSQSLKGFAAETWVSYLDAAGYPRESKLPPGYQYPAPAPLVERRPAAEAAAAPQRPATTSTEEAPSPPPLIRF